jgi:deoxyribonuclease V
MSLYYQGSRFGENRRKNARSLRFFGYIRLMFCITHRIMGQVIDTGEKRWDAMEPLHEWTLDPQEAAGVQDRLRKQLILAWDGRPVRSVAGVDIGLGEHTARAAVVVLSFPDLSPVEAVVAEVPLAFPYIPGLLAFREGPAFLAAWEKLRSQPDLVMFDGQGIAHPRGVGIAAQMGLWVDLPTIGVAKSRLFGKHEEPGSQAGDRVPLSDPRRGGHVIGMVLRSKTGVKPLFISPGHRMDAEHAAEFTWRCVAGYRLPEPTRWAHKVAGGQTLPAF